MIDTNLNNNINNYISSTLENSMAHETLNFISLNNDFWSRNNQKGHITASAWVLNPTKTKVLLTHHRGLNMWFQLGGHIEMTDQTIYDACLRELEEESGIKGFKLLQQEIFDIDVHLIPTSSKGVPEHFHYDIRMLYEVDDSQPLFYDINESNEVKWVPIFEINQLTKEASVLRMLEKTILL